MSSFDLFIRQPICCCGNPMSSNDPGSLCDDCFEEAIKNGETSDCQRCKFPILKDYLVLGGYCLHCAQQLAFEKWLLADNGV